VAVAEGAVGVQRQAARACRVQNGITLRSKARSTSVTAPDYNATFSVTGWMDFVFGMSGEIECGFSEDVTSFLDGGYALGVSLGASMFDPERIVPTSTATTYAPRRDVFVELLKRREIQN
jgi:hypothetical protein